MAHEESARLLGRHAEERAAEVFGVLEGVWSSCEGRSQHGLRSEGQIGLALHVRIVRGSAEADDFFRICRANATRSKRHLLPYGPLAASRREFATLGSVQGKGI